MQSTSAFLQANNFSVFYHWRKKKKSSKTALAGLEVKVGGSPFLKSHLRRHLSP
jgi:hypothetical protein